MTLVELSELINPPKKPLHGGENMSKYPKVVMKNKEYQK